VRPVPPGSADRPSSLTRRRALALFGAAGSGVLAGCAGGRDDAATGRATGSSTPTATPTPAPPDVADTFPSDEDPDTGLEVHQLTTGEGVTDVQDHYTGYYHHDPLYGDWVVTWTVAASGKRHYKTNVRTGERVPLAGWNGMTGIQVRGADLFTTRVDGPDRWLAALDLDAMTWTDHGAGTHDDPWRISGSLAVDPAGSHVLAYEAPVGRLPSVDGPEHRTRHHDLEAGTSTVVRESPHLRNHYEFSPAGDGTFRAINEWIDRPNSSRFGTERFVVGHVDRGGGEPLELEGEFWASDGDTAGPRGTGFNMAHPFWAPDGRCHTDVVWHPELPAGEFELVTFDFPSVDDPFAPIPKRHQTRRRYPGRYWSHHFTPVETGGGDWFVGDGDVGGTFTVGGGIGRTYVNAGLLLEGGDMVYVPLARVPRPLHDSRTHLLPGGEGVVTVWKHDLRPDVEGRHNVFLIELPVRYQRAMAGDDAALRGLLDDGRATRVENRLE